MEDIDSKPLVVMPMERKDGTYALRLCLDQGVVTPDMMQRLLDVMNTFGLGNLRAISGQRINLEGVPGDKLDDVVAALGTSVAKCPPGVTVCPGGEACKLGMQPTRDLTNQLLALVKEHAPYPYKVKSGVSGCNKGCALSLVRDIGLVGRAKGWDVYFGGGAAVSNAGVGMLLGSKLTEDEALETVAKALVFYKEHGQKKERTANMVRRLGHDVVTEALTLG